MSRFPRLLFPLIFFLPACDPSREPVQQEKQVSVSPELSGKDRKSQPGITDLIHLAEPDMHDTVSSPLIIKGEAKGSWYFEASFPVMLLDRDSTILSRSNAMALGEWMTEEFVPFEATLTFADSLINREGYVVLEKANPSGLAEHDRSYFLPVFFSGNESLK